MERSAKRKTVVSLSLSFFLSPSFSFHASFKHTERSPPREILPPPYSNASIFQSRWGKRGEVVWFS